MLDGNAERRFRVQGRVQGVGFRWWIRREARRLGLRGTVRNCPDGTVEVRASGNASALAELRDLLRRGPPGARVDAVEEQDLPASGLPGDFEIVG